MFSLSISFEVSLRYLNYFLQTSWYPLEYFGQCVASCDVVANHSWGEEKRLIKINLSYTVTNKILYE